MKKKVLATTAVATVLGFSSFSAGDFSSVPVAEAAKGQNDNGQQGKGKTVSEPAPLLAEFQPGTTAGSPVDVGLANDERLIDMLQKEGKITKGASAAAIDKGLNAFLANKAAAGAEAAKAETAFGKAYENSLKEKADGTSLTSGKGNKLGQTTAPETVQQEQYTGEVRADKVLVLAIDFPDYKASSISPEETDMFYEDYTHEHFQNMIFGPDGYEGPNGETFVSMKQYYEQQSGGSYTVDGTVAGWYTASQPAAYYGGNYPTADDSDRRARELVYEALTKAGSDPNVDLSEYDVWDRDDYDGDGVHAEPDGIIDHLMVIHAGVGEEAGGGKLGTDAIWSHRWNLGRLVAVPGGSSNSDRFGGLLGAYDYTIEPEDGAAGVFAHEFGHDLGLPDEYDTQYTGAGEPVSYWSLMSSGSWAGDIPGTEPPGFSPYAKEMLENIHGGNWLSGSTINAADVTATGTDILLDEGVTKGKNNDAVRINLPQKSTTIAQPASGEFAYFSGNGNGLNNSMSTTVDLTNAASAELSFKAWYDIEQDWDYASVKVNGTSIEGNITTTANPYEQNPGHGITGSSNGWTTATFDLSPYVGQTIELEFNYWTDGYVALPGFFADDITVTADGSPVVTDNAESDSAFTFTGFTKNDGKKLTNHYYLLEWRSHNGVDEGLAHIRRGESLMSFDQGLVVWYVDELYDNNWTGAHPGEGFLGVVDADQHTNYWSDGTVGSTRYQVHDAAFNYLKESPMFLNYPGQFTMKDNYTQRNPLFDDSADYSNPGLVDAGRNVPTYGLKFRVVGQSTDGTVGQVKVFK